MVRLIEFKILTQKTHKLRMHLVLVDGITHERVDDRWWSLVDAHAAMECLRNGCHLAVISGAT